MTIAQLSKLTEEAHQRYLAFIDRMRGLFHRTLMDKDFGSPAMLQRVENEAEEAAMGYYRDEWHALEAAALEIAQIARTTTLREITSIESSELTDAIAAHAEASADYLASELLYQIMRDVTTLKKELRRVNLEVSISTRSRGSSRRAAMMEYLIGNKSDIQFTFHDRASRKWKSSAYVRTIWRQALLSIYNETVLFTLADHGLHTAQIHSESPGASHHGMIIALSSAAELPTYSEIRDVIFHPNANAYLKMVETADV